jgi:hypothetical protein
MSASSVTGIGPGESHGMKKPANNCGCPCGSTPEEVVSNPPLKRGCVVSYSYGSKTVYRSGQKQASAKVC